MATSSPALDNFIVAFGQFMKTGETDALYLHCERGTNTDIFNIYRNGFYRACIDALASNYPAVVALLGEAYFRSSAKVYVTQWPPEHGSLAGYGRSFPSYLETLSVELNLPCLADIARLDRAWLDVYFSCASIPLTPQRIAELAQGENELDLQCIALSKSTELLSLDYPVAQIWRKLKDFGRITDVIELSKQPECVLVWRHNSEMLLRQLSRTEFVFFSALKEGLSLERAVENAYGDDSEFELDSLFLNLITAGLFIENHTALQSHQMGL